MGIPCDDVVIIRRSEREADGEPSVITVNCPDKTGLGCDLCRIILFFGLSIVRGDVSTDGKWCYIIFWVVGTPNTRSELRPPKPPDVFLIKIRCCDRRGLLYDLTSVLCELELVIKRVKVSTTPDGKVMDLFFVTDTRELLHTTKRQEDACNELRSVIGDSILGCEIEMVGPEITACSQSPPSFLPSAITTEYVFQRKTPSTNPGGLLTSKSVSIKMDNMLSPAHTLVQISCQDHKGLLYDVMRTLKDYNIQVSYGRFCQKQRRNCELDLFIMQADGKKIVAPSKQQALSARLEAELLQPLRVAVISRGPDTELLVANPVELSGKGRPLVFYDITHALQMLKTGIFSAEIGRHMIGDREWEVYRILLDEGEGQLTPREKIEEEVWKMLMGWN
ncbi:hypothetical protein MLD38_019565 [Melastoma candidum]|uniref:Uncharacterized protein n=1 Tax=Melastoma candidum TaxID=119954 RepID=A0ACB9R0G9_9MYRT|nr:hypothetical protein MLD38_019565 [Melastoma candidum]